MRTLSAVLAIGLCAAAPAVTAQDRPTFDEGTTMARIQEEGKLVVGVKYDQPGMGLMNPKTGELEGFDIEMAKIVARALGLGEDDIEFKESVSKNRIPFIDNGIVDVVIAFFGMTAPHLKAIDMAGPYFQTGMQALVREADKDKYRTYEDLRGVKACGATGSDSLRVVKDIGAVPIAFDTYSECAQQVVSGGVDVLPLTTILLAGYVTAFPGTAIAVEPFNPYEMGFGLRKGDTAFCEFLNETIVESIEDGSWQKAFDRTIATLGVVDRIAPPTEFGSGC